MVLLVAVGLSSFTVRSQVSTNEIGAVNKKAKKGIVLNFQHQENCWNQGDIECFMKAYAKRDVVQSISSTGVVFGYANILSKYKEKYAPTGTLGQLSFDKFTFRKLIRKYYFVTGRYNLRIKHDREPVRGWFSVIMKKEKTGWVILTDHSS